MSQQALISEEARSSEQARALEQAQGAGHSVSADRRARRRALIRAGGLVFSAAAVLAASPMLGGCVAMPPLNLQPPQLAVSDIEIADIGLNQIVFVINVNAFNPNDVEIPLSNVRFDLDLLNGPFASGVLRQGFVSLPARVSRDVGVEFAVPTVRVVQLIRSFKSIEWTQIAYRLRGSATWGPNGITLPFERGGDLNAVKQLVELFGR